MRTFVIALYLMGGGLKKTTTTTATTLNVYCPLTGGWSGKPFYIMYTHTAEHYEATVFYSEVHLWLYLVRKKKRASQNCICSMVSKNSHC